MSLLCVIPILLLLGLAARFQWRRLPFPPGPRSLPLIGNMLMMDQLTHRGLAKLAKKYGGIFHLRMGRLHMVAVSSTEMAREVLQVQDHVFSNRPATIAISYLTYDRADLVFAHYGPFWRKMRKLCVMKLFSRKRAESWASVRDEVDDTVRSVAGLGGQPINIRELGFTLSRNLIYRAAFGSCCKDGQDEFIRILQEFSKLFGAFNIADFIPYLRWLDPQGLNKRMVKARKSLDRFINSVIDDHLKKEDNKASSEGGGEVDTDMVDDLLAFYCEEARVNDESEDLQNSIKLTKDNIKGIIMDLMFGGTETVALILEWVMAELMHNPKDLKKVQQELVDVVGQPPPAYRRGRPREAHPLPLCSQGDPPPPPSNSPPPPRTSEDTVVGGYYVPARSQVLINVWAIGRDPESFMPARFLNPGVPDYKGSNCELIPFGSGRRSCPGMQLGLYALELSVAHLLHCFTWELPDGMKPSEVDTGEAFGLTAPRATPLVAVPSQRLAGALYRVQPMD